MKVRRLRNSINKFSERATQETSTKLNFPGAVLAVVRGMILAHTFPSPVLCVKAAINQDMKALVPIDKLDPEFLCMMFWAYNHRIVELVEIDTRHAKA